MSDAELANRVEQIHQASLGALRVAKALVDFARTAGQQLHQAQTMLDVGDFDEQVATTLSITPDKAAALIHVAQDPAVAAADVTPAREMTLTEVLGLVARLFDSLLPSQ